MDVVVWKWQWLANGVINLVCLVWPIYKGKRFNVCCAMLVLAGALSASLSVSNRLPCSNIFLINNNSQSPFTVERLRLRRWIGAVGKKHVQLNEAAPENYLNFSLNSFLHLLCSTTLYCTVLYSLLGWWWWTISLPPRLNFKSINFLTEQKLQQHRLMDRDQR